MWPLYGLGGSLQRTAMKRPVSSYATWRVVAGWTLSLNRSVTYGPYIERQADRVTTARVKPAIPACPRSDAVSTGDDPRSGPSSVPR